MSRLVLVLCLLVAVCGAKHLSVLSRLRSQLTGSAVSDNTVDIEEFPWLVSLEKIVYGRLRHVCGGSIIDSTWVLTTAHCIERGSPRELYVRAGSSFREFGGYLYRVATVIGHEHYNRRRSRDYDFALLETSEPIVFGSIIQAVHLGSDEIASGSKVSIACWGTDIEEDPVQLSVVNASIQDRDTCKSTFAKWREDVTERMICAVEEEGFNDACADEGGAPLVVGDTQYGILSWGSASTEAGSLWVYSYVPAIRSWITEITGV